MVAEQEMDEKWEVTESLILSDVLITISTVDLIYSQAMPDIRV
jgi:hypothetical protein